MRHNSQPAPRGRYVRKARLSAAEVRKRNADRMGIAILLAVALATAGLIWGAYQVDKAQGLSVGQSLALWGL
jgi:hypothetical protein